MIHSQTKLATPSINAQEQPCFLLDPVQVQKCGEPWEIVMSNYVKYLKDICSNICVLYDYQFRLLLHSFSHQNYNDLEKGMYKNEYL